MAPALIRRGDAVLAPSDSLAVTDTGPGTVAAPAGRDAALALAVGTAVLVPVTAILSLGAKTALPRRVSAGAMPAHATRYARSPLRVS